MTIKASVEHDDAQNLRKRFTETFKNLTDKEISETLPESSEIVTISDEVINNKMARNPIDVYRAHSWMLGGLFSDPRSVRGLNGSHYEVAIPGLLDGLNKAQEKKVQSSAYNIHKVVPTYLDKYKAHINADASVKAATVSSLSNLALTPIAGGVGPISATSIAGIDLAVPATITGDNIVKAHRIGRGMALTLILLGEIESVEEFYGLSEDSLVNYLQTSRLTRQAGTA